MPTEEDPVFYWTGFKHTSPATVEPQAAPPGFNGVTYLPLTDEEIKLLGAFRWFKAVMLAPEATFTWRTLMPGSAMPNTEAWAAATPCNCDGNYALRKAYPELVNADSGHMAGCPKHILYIWNRGGSGAGNP